MSAASSCPGSATWATVCTGQSERMAPKRIAVTGGPGGGKTTVWRELARTHAGAILAVPEVATLMFQHVFPAVADARERDAVQRSIYHVQRNLEAFYEGRLRAGQAL